MKSVSRVLLACTLIFAVALTWAVDLAPGMGVTLVQISFPDVGAGGVNSAVGMVQVDLNALRSRTGIPAGYINVATAQGWVVRNLPVLAESLYPYSGINTSFALGNQAGTAVTQLTVAIQYTDTLLTSFSITPAGSFPVGTRQISTGGAGTGAGGPPTPPTMNDVLFGNPSDNDTITQFDHPNVEAAQNQCMPMSVANSLQYLKDTQGLQLPHAHKPGIKGDDSLVGQLDTSMARPVTDRQHGSGTWGLIGKLKYLASNNLASRVSTTHWGVGGAETGASNVSVSTTGSGGASITATSTGKGASVNFTDVFQALKDGQDCEMIYSWPSVPNPPPNPPAQPVTPAGAHAVDIVAAGKFRGQPWLVHASDLDQSRIDASGKVAGDNTGAGPSGFQFEYLSGPDATGKYHLSGTNTTIDQVICQKYVPPPVTPPAQTTETILRTVDPAGHSCCVDSPPSTVNVAVTGTTMTVSGSASWLPMTGTIAANGSFSLNSTATVAGFSNVFNTFVGTAQGNVYSGTIAVGARGELPTAKSISWDVNITVPTVTVTPALPAIRVNGFRNAYAAATSELARVSLSMKAGGQAGKTGDWWIVSVAGGNIMSFDIPTMSWQNGLKPVYTGALFDFPFFALPYTNLPAGTNDFYFAFDATPDGALTVPSLVFDTVRVTVQ